MSVLTVLPRENYGFIQTIAQASVFPMALPLKEMVPLAVPFGTEVATAASGTENACGLASNVPAHPLDTDGLVGVALIPNKAKGTLSGAGCVDENELLAVADALPPVVTVGSGPLPV